MDFRRATFGIAIVVGRQAWKQRSGSGSTETSQFEAFEQFAFFWKRMLLTCVNKILVQNGHGFSVVYWDQEYALRQQPPHPCISMLGWIKSSTIVTKSNVDFALTGTFKTTTLKSGGGGRAERLGKRSKSWRAMFLLHNPDLVNVIFGVTTFFYPERSV